MLIIFLLILIKFTPKNKISESYLGPILNFLKRYGKFAFLVLLLISLYRIAQELSSFIVTNINEQGLFILVVCITLLILGFIMETLSLILIMMPIFSISIAAMNIDLIWFGIIFTLMIECALITPPVGLNIYVLQAIGKAKMSEIAKGVIPFVIIMLFTVFVVYLFPDLALYIPFKL